ncbi:MAG: hypothetical protein ACJ8KU_03220 [Chthoniobacterales bacterium]
MRGVLVVLGLLALTGVFAWQKHSQDAAAPQTTTAPRQVSEHDWAKQSLDKAAKVKQDVLRQRRDNRVP